jgi:hypothetical protein
MVGAVLLALIVLPVAVFEIAAILLERQVNRRIADLRAQGYPTTLAECAPAPVPAGRNAGVIYEALFAGQGGFLTGAPGPGRPWEDLYLDETPAGSQTRAAFLARPDVLGILAELKRAAELPDCVSAGVSWRPADPTGWPLGLHDPARRRAGELVGLKAQSQAEQGKVADALTWTLVGVRQTDHYRQFPTLIEQLVGMACETIVLDDAWRGLRDADIPPSASEELRDYLSTLSTPASFRRALVTERAYYIEVYDWLGRGGGALRHAPRNLEQGREWLYASHAGHPWRAWDELVAIDQTTREVALAERPFYQITAQVQRLDAEVESHWSILGFDIVASPLLALEKANQDQAERETFALALAAKAYKHDRGSYPESLKDLSGYLGKNLPKDPFTGTDYCYLRRGQGFSLWREYQVNGKRRITLDADK